MRLDRIPVGISVFIDANIFIYHFTGVSPQCTAFLGSCEGGRLAGITGVHVLAEVAHRLMAVEAVRKGLITPGNVAAKFRAHPDIVRALSDYQTNLNTLMAIGIQVLFLGPDDLVASAAVRRVSGLLTNDSLTAAMLQRERIRALATSDPDFRRLPDVRIYEPTDLPTPLPEEVAPSRLP
jgi:predicted nucleic acid-binding protein